MFFVYINFFIVVCRMRLKSPCIIWCDNFSKTLRRTIPTLAKDVYSLMLWTGVAVFSDANCTNIDHSIRTDNNEVVIPAMPPTICENRSEVLDGLKFVHDKGRHILEDSLVFKFGVHNVPLQITDPEDKEEKQQPIHRNSMHIVHPYKIIDKNIGSNIGLVSILREDFYDVYGMGTDECKQYLCLNVDENIFWRTLKVFRH